MAGKQGESISRVVDPNGSFVRAVSEGNLSNVKQLVHSFGLSCCENWYGSYALLRDTIESGHFEIAKFLLQEGAKVDCKTDRLSTPLHFAVQQRNLELVVLLLEKNAPIDACNGQNETALHLAAKEGYAAIVQVLLENNADVSAQSKKGSTPLLLAAEGRHGKVVRMLLKHAYANSINVNTPSVSEPEKIDSTQFDRILLCNQTARQKISKLVVRIVNFEDDQRYIVDDLINYGLILDHEYVTEPLLSNAVQKNYVVLVRHILNNDTYPFDAKSNPFLLHKAVTSGHKRMVELLLNSGFDANAKDKKGKTSLYYSLNCKKDSSCTRIIQLLLSHGAAIEETPELLHKAVDLGLVDVCKLLIENGANVNSLNASGHTSLFISCSYESEEGIRQKKDEIVKLLLDSGADVSVQCYGMTAFHGASLKGRKEAVSIFLSCGVDVDLRDGHDCTPLHCAVARKNKEIIKILCENGANVEARSLNGNTPLHAAAFEGLLDEVQLLLKFGADIDAQGFKNETALHRACSYNRLNVVEFFVNNGCDINAETVDGKTALDLAISYAGLYNNLSLSPLKPIMQYVIKLKAAGLHVSEKNLFALNNLKDLLIVKESDSLEFATFQQKCEKEVDRMRKKKLNDETTLLDVLAKSKNPNFAGNKSLMQGLETVNFEEFPIYKSIITNNLERSKLRFELKNSVRKWLDILVRKSSKSNGKEGLVLPLELLECIISHLTNGEIKCLIRCGRALKSN